MIKHLHFAYTEHLGGGVVIDIEVKSGIVTAEVSSVFHNTPNTEVSFDEETSAKWLAELDNLRTDKWKPRYRPQDIFVMDGCSWRLDINYRDGMIRHTEGENAFPDNWDSFEDLMSQIYPFLRDEA